MKVPSPCVDVCKFKHAGHCIGCGMTKKQRKKFKKLDGRKAKLAFIKALRLRQLAIGLKTNWERAYRRRCEKKGVACPLDRLPAPTFDPRACPENPLISSRNSAMGIRHKPRPAPSANRNTVSR